MKKVILLAVVTTLCSAAFSQATKKPDSQNDKDSTSKTVLKKADQDTINLSSDGKVIAQVVSKSDTLLIKDVKYIRIGQKVFSVADLGNPGIIALTVPITWISAIYEYLDESSSGLSKKQIENLQLPIAEKYQQWQFILQQQRMQQQQKQ